MSMLEAIGNLTGILGSLKNVLDTGLGFIQTRLELFSAELQEERQRFFQMILHAAALVTVGILALALFTATIIFAFPENLRLAALGGLTVIYSVVTVLLYRKLNAKLQNCRPLSGTIEGIKRDRESLRSGR